MEIEESDALESSSVTGGKIVVNGGKCQIVFHNSLGS